MNDLSTTDAAARLGLSTRRVRELASSGAIPSRREGRQWLVSGEAVAARMRARPGPGRPGHLLADVVLAELVGSRDRPRSSKRTLASARSLVASATTEELARTLSASTVEHELVEAARLLGRSRGLERRRAAGVLAAARRSWRERDPRGRTTMAHLGRPSARSVALEARDALQSGDMDWALRAILHADHSFRSVDDPEALEDYVKPVVETGDVRLDVLLAALTARSCRVMGLPAPAWTIVRPLDPPWVVRSRASIPDPGDVARRLTRTPPELATRGIVLAAADLVRA